MALIVRSEPETGSAPIGAPCTTDRPSRDDVARWLGHLVGPDGCVELRAVGVTRKGHRGEHVESSFYTANELLSMATAALSLSGRAKGIYWTLNPIHAGLYLDVNHASAKTTDVLSRRWMLVDCDPLKEQADQSATDAEKAASRTTAEAVRDYLTGRGWPEPVLADSGNGHHLLYRIDLPNDDDAKSLVRNCLEALAKRFSTPEVSIDTSVHDAPRICKLYGTIARKGNPTAERPHRYSRVLRIPASLEVVPAGWLAALALDLVAAEATPEVAAAATPTIPITKGLKAKAKPTVDPQRAYALAALRNEANKVASAAPGERNATLNAAAFAIGQLVATGAINDGDAIEALTTAGLMAGPNIDKIRDTVLRGIRDGKANPRDLSGVGQGGGGNVVARDPGNDDPDAPNEADDDPHRLARIFLAAEASHPEGRTLRYWVERWHRWDGAAWRTAPDAEIASEVVRVIKAEFDRLVAGTNKPPRPVTTKVVSNVVQALKGLVLLTYRACPRQPAWLDGPGPDPVECVVARNGILYLPEIVAGAGQPRASTPRLFTPNALAYDFDPNAPKPTAWLGFLDSLWGNDPDSILSLQEWFGYLLTADTRQQKMLMLIGPPRSGKGTICRILESVVGFANVAAPTLSGLATNFGLAPLIGRSVAIIADARLSGRADAQVIIERILSITGEDSQTIDRKHREDWTGNLRTRFVLGSNELPRLGDSSGAFPSRIILLKLVRTFYGNEDTHLGARILCELPGILLWAIVGWNRLRERGRFLQPASGKELIDELKELSSPIKTFLAERCLTGPNHRIPVQQLYDAWKKWCGDHGRDHPGDVAGFGRTLRSALPSLGTIQPRIEGSRIRVFTGIDLNDSPDPLF